MAQPLYKDQLCEISQDGDILEVTIAGVHFEEEDVDKVINKVTEVTKGKEFLILTEVEAECRVSFWGLRKLAGADAMKYAVAKAYVLRSDRHQLMADIFFRIYTPSKPIKIFDDKTQAREWLESFIVP